MTTRSFAGFALLASAAGLVFVLGCGPKLPPSKPASEFTPQEAAGAEVYAKACARCHYPTNTHDLHGPGLQGTFKKKFLPSGAPANDERVESVILRGRNMMPATRLTDQQMEDLMAYLHTL